MHLISMTTIGALGIDGAPPKGRREREAKILDLYTTLPWPTLCEAVQCLQVRRLSVRECTETLAAIAKAGLTTTEQNRTQAKKRPLFEPVIQGKMQAAARGTMTKKAAEIAGDLSGLQYW